MAQGTLQAQIQTLQAAISGIATLTGDGQTGLSGGASATANVSVDGDGLSVDLQAQFTVDFDADAAVGGLMSVFSKVRGDVNLTALDGLQDFGAKMGQVQTAFEGDLIGKLTQLIDAFQKVPTPDNPMGIFAALLDQLADLLGGLEGPEAEQIRAWMASLQQQLALAAPLQAELDQGGDPAEILIRLLTNSLNDILDIFGFNQVKPALDFLDQAPFNMLPQVLIDDLGAAFGQATPSVDAVLAAAPGDQAAFSAAVAAHQDALRQIQRKLRPVIDILQRIAAGDLLQAGVLERRLRRLMDDALGVKIHENQKIDDPYAKLLDRIDAEIDKIDLRAASDAVRNTFDHINGAIDGVDLPNLDQLLSTQLSQVDEAVKSLQGGVTGLLDDIRKTFDNLVQQLKDALSTFGIFDDQNRFRFNFEQDLRNALDTARLAVAGDPDNPDAPSVKGTLDDFQQTVDGLLQQLTTLLQPVEAAADQVIGDAVNGIQDFSAFLNGLDIPALMTTLAAKVDEIVDALVPIDLTALADPIVAELNKNAENLGKINTDDLNDLLKAALSAALDVVISIDFTASISDPLKEEMKVVKAVPAGAIQVLQVEYEKAIALLDELSPEQLLDALLSAFDVIREAVDKLDATALLAPLDQLHEDKLRAPIAALKPSQLLEPLNASYTGLFDVFDGISGQMLLKPLTDQLDGLKHMVANLNLDAPVDALLGAIDKLKADLAQLKPSTLLTGVVQRFAQIEAELDKFKPSVVFQPVTQMAQPLLQALEDVQQQTVDALFQLFQVPLATLERIDPAKLGVEIGGKIDLLLNALQIVDPNTAFNRLKANHFDLRAALQGDAFSFKLEMSAQIDPQVYLGEFMDAYNQAVTALTQAKNNVLVPDLAELYVEFQQRLLDLLPPYARAALDTETFKRVMRLADPTRFMTELDQRFDAIKNKLIPVRPEDLAAELDGVYDSVNAKLANFDLSGSLNQIKQTVASLKAIVGEIRVDFIAADVDEAINAFRAVLEGLDPARIGGDLDAIHDAVLAVIDQTKPSVVLGGLQAPIDQVKGILNALDPGVRLKQPLLDAWEAVAGALAQVDFTVILKPVVDKLDELEAQLIAELKRTEGAFDTMLGKGKAALGGGSFSVSASVSVGGGIG